MKKIFLMAMFAALACVACDKDNFSFSGIEEGYGVLSFADADFIVSEEVETRADAAKDNTVIWVLKEDGSMYDLAPENDDIDYTTYGAVKSKGITLPGGNYTFRAQTGAKIPMAGPTPVYGIEKEFSITAGAVTPLGELTLKLYKQVKVKVQYNPVFLSSLVNNNVTTEVAINDESKMTFEGTNPDSGFLYLELTEDNKDTGVTMEILVNAEMNVKEGNVTSVKTQKMSATISGVKPCQYRQININKEEIKDGGANFTIVVDGLEVDTELSTDISASEGSLGNDPNAPKGDGGIKLINIAGLNANTTPTKDAWNNSFTEDEMDGDRIYLTSDAKSLRDFLAEVNLVKSPLKNIMIVGGSRIVYYLANELSKKKYKIKLIESNLAVAEALASELPRVTVIHGNGTRHELLIEEGIEAMDAFVALTDIDEENMVVTMFANKMKVKKTITQIKGDDLVGMLDELGIENTVSPQNIVANRIISYIRALANKRGSNVLTLHRLVNDQVEALEFYAKKPARIYNKPLKELKLKENCLVACIIRENEVIIPNGNDCIQLGDNVIVVTTHKNFDDLTDILE